jgi:hypothetical protein
MPAPRHTSPVPLFTGSVGLNNKIKPYRLPFSIDSGVCALEKASNVVITSTGELRSIKGTITIESGIFHSLYPSNKGRGFYVVRQGLETSELLYGRLGSGSISWRILRQNLPRTIKFSYFKYATYVCASSLEYKFRLIEDELSPWVESDYTGPETDDFKDFPNCQHIETLAGRALGSVDTILYFSEYGLHGIYSTISNWIRVPTTISYLIAVATGVFIATVDEIYFLKGLNPDTWTLELVANYGAPPYAKSASLVDPSNYGLDSSALAGLGLTDEGPALFLQNGSVAPLINDVVEVKKKCYTVGAVQPVERLIITSGE